MSKKVIIIGAGISGLTAGIYACKAGFDVDIYESHTVAGGECTGWNRNGFHIDGCIHWMVGTLKSTGLYKIWETCGALGDDVEVINHDYISAYKHDDKTYHFYSNLDKLEQEFLKISPNDRKPIRKFIKAAKACQNIEVPVNKPYEYLSFNDKIKLLLKFVKVGKHLNKARKYSVKEYIADIKSPIVRDMIQIILPEQFAASSLIAALGFRSKGDGGRPAGGSCEMIERMQKKLESLGGHIHLKSEIDEIVIDNGVAVGIRTKNDNQVHHADYIVPSVDAYALLHKLLGGKYKDSYFDKRFSNPSDYLLASSTIIALGVETDMSKRPYCLCINLKTPIQVGTTKHTSMIVRHYSFDPTLCSEGKSTIEVVLPDFEFDHWNELKQSSLEAYKNEKARVLNAVTAEIERVYPEVIGKIKMTDVATPVTFNRYCDAYRGSYMAFLTLPNIGSLMPDNHKGVIEGVKNMYLAGQWVFQNGGLPMAAIAGKFAIQRICKQEGLSIKI